MSYHSGLPTRRLASWGWALCLLLAGAAETSTGGQSIAPCAGTPNCVSSRDRDEGRYIPPLSFDGPAEEAWQVLQSALAEEPRTEIVERSRGTLRAVCTSLVFQFVDDLEFRLIPEEHVIEVRSASRVGYWDFGVNRRRIERIRGRFNTLMARF